MRLLLLLLSAVLPTLAAGQTTPATAASSPAPAIAASAASTASANVDLDDIRTFARVYSLVKQAYVDPVDDRRLMDAAIRGLLSNLDPHSEFLDTRGLEQLSEDTTGEYAGIGVQVADVNGELRIIAPIDGTPAARAGIRPGDLILAIDGIAVDSQNLDRMVNALRGPSGSQVKLSILHEKADLADSVTLTRERIHIDSVRVSLLEPGYARVRISEFQQGTAGELRDQLSALIKAHGALRGAVLDLRSNPGGLVTSAVAVADTFLDRGVIVTTRGRLKQADMNFSATPGDLLQGAPMVVLIDNGTASAAEIVAGALKDNQRALSMGRRSFGKGSVQTVLPLDDDHAVKLTTARYYTPAGTSIQAEGIRPDIALADLAVNPRDTPPTPILSEADLPNHLSATDTSPAAASKTPGALALDDYALSEALHVLKGMVISRAARHASPDGA
ncbi:MAG TPA: S41 family peptidase [Rhodanobacteraceae bacterium]|nr:S41 family peptidase [Rhodanobacteraceae bacterium]